MKRWQDSKTQLHHPLIICVSHWCCSSPPSVSVTWVISLSYRCASSQLWQITIYLTHLTFELPINARSSTQLCHRQQTEHPDYHFQTKMKSLLVFLLVLILCYLCRAQTPNINDDISVQAVESEEARAQTLRPTTEAEAGQQAQGLQSDIWVELRYLRDMVVEQKVELRHLTARVTAAESLVEELLTENTGTLS